MEQDIKNRVRKLVKCLLSLFGFYICIKYGYYILPILIIGLVSAVVSSGIFLFYVFIVWLADDDFSFKSWVNNEGDYFTFDNFTSFVYFTTFITMVIVLISVVQDMNTNSNIFLDESYYDFIKDWKETIMRYSRIRY